ncbi:hypothetical protein HN748_02150 [Candidatus Peregrinibacteria bacterium]|jgi:hypothetical protein|nr:hypothetical protein [Candidatus Peregrinibacteria bacterium]MBT7484258.1 hypothetical protein [Candidatus Peregrinibacteria bacterium]MBT7703010.1 hypothetical protein [Candidatus Peregrinibacteria bacterium]
MKIAEVSDEAASSPCLDTLSIQLINLAIRHVCLKSAGDLDPQDDLSVESLIAIEQAIGGHRVKLEGAEATFAFLGGKNPEQDAQVFLQGLRSRVQAGTTTE